MHRSSVGLMARLRHDQEGFSMTELLVALGVLFVSLLALARTATVAFTDTALARQRQAANQIANGLLEQVRGLPYDTLGKGLRSSDLAADPDVSACDDGYYMGECPPGDGERLVATPSELPTTPPLVPHKGTVGPPTYPTTYDWSLYVTEANDAPPQGAYRVTAIVSWTPGQRGPGLTTIESQTLMYAPDGCVDTATHPFAGPCQPFFYGTGSVGGGAVATTGTVQGLVFDEFVANFLGQTADAQIEQVKRLDGSVALPGAARISGGIRTAVGGAAATSAADDDPSTPVSEYERTPVGPQPQAAVSLSGEGNTLSISLGGSESGATVSTSSAGSGNTCATQIDGQPCGHAGAQQTGAVVGSLALGGGVGSMVLFEADASSDDVTAYLRRVTSTGTDDGSIQEQVSWSLPTMRFGGLPSDSAAPPNWEGYWVRLSGFTASATAQAGWSTLAPSVSVTGQVRYWNGSGYSSVNVTPAGGLIPIAALDHSAGIGDGNTVRTEISGSLLIDPSTTQQKADGQIRTEARAQIGSPITGEIQYRVTRNQAVLADLVIVVDAGMARAAAQYQEVPS